MGREPAPRAGAHGTGWPFTHGRFASGYVGARPRLWSGRPWAHRCGPSRGSSPGRWRSEVAARTAANQAFAYLLEASRDDPEDHRLHRAIGGARAVLGDSEGSAAAFARALDLIGSDDMISNSIAVSRLQAHAMLGEAAMAAAVFEDLVTREGWRFRVDALTNHPHLDRVAGHPDFAAVVDRLRVAGH